MIVGDSGTTNPWPRLEGFARRMTRRDAGILRNPWFQYQKEICLRPRLEGNEDVCAKQCRRRPGAEYFQDLFVLWQTSLHRLQSGQD